jgi:Rps23 Pro-64 3,4-dihydroxylase Tpa1-like proline 4-hydroxylase
MSSESMGIEYNVLANGIYVYENIMQDFDLFFNNIKKVFDNDLIGWDAEPDIVVNGQKTIDKKIRDVNVCTVPYHLSKILLDSHNNPTQAFNNIVSNKLFISLGLIEKEYCKKYKINPKEHDVYYILKYNKDNFFNNHIDDSASFPRTVSVLYYLNDDYEGGEIEFPEFNIKYKPKSNSAILFPSNYLYYHNVSPIISGERYVIVSWLMNNKYPIE